MVMGMGVDGGGGGTNKKKAKVQKRQIPTSTMPGPFWLHSVMHFLRRKAALSSSKKDERRKQATARKQDSTGGANSLTAGPSPAPRMEKGRPLLPPQLRRFEGRKQV